MTVPSPRAMRKCGRLQWGVVSDAVVVADRFELLHLAGRGGMGVVYRAKDRVTGGDAAVKILHDEAPEGHRNRLVREARVLAALTHPAFVRYLDFGHTGEPSQGTGLP